MSEKTAQQIDYSDGYSLAESLFGQKMRDVDTNDKQVMCEAKRKAYALDLDELRRIADEAKTDLRENMVPDYLAPEQEILSMENLRTVIHDVIDPAINTEGDPTLGEANLLEYGCDNQ